jgi:hypothetical protein
VSSRLAFENFNGPFVTHGIDVISDSDRPAGEAVYIVAVNHLPHPDHLAEKTREKDGEPSSGTTSPTKARSQLELFHHVVGSSTVKHIRSIYHPLVTTPNDVVALSPSSFLVTNDHFNREGLLRSIETVIYSSKWTNTIHLRLSDADPAAPDAASDGVHGSVALQDMHNNNGLGHGAKPTEVLVINCVSAILNLADVVDAAGNTTLSIRESIPMDSIIDNPSYFADPYATAEKDLSGFVLAGLSHAVSLDGHVRDPDAKDGVMVWYVGDGSDGGRGNRSRKLLFADDGSRIRTSSAALLVAIDPATEGGKRKAWLFVTGFLSKSMVAVKVDLEA